ncbi:hypothetical protein L9F63_019094, partial [Diploptera punctata]
TTPKKKKEKYLKMKLYKVNMLKFCSSGGNVCLICWPSSHLLSNQILTADE